MQDLASDDLSRVAETDDLRRCAPGKLDAIDCDTIPHKLNLEVR